MTLFPLHIIDTTLRDGEQAPGVVFSLDEKLKIADLLDRTGMPEIEIGMPAISLQETKEIRTICTSGFGFKSLGWCRGNEHDIDLARKACCDGVHLSLPVRSEERRVEKECTSWCRSRWSPYH